MDTSKKLQELTVKEKLKSEVICMQISCSALSKNGALIRQKPMLKHFKRLGPFLPHPIPAPKSMLS
jgi:hypothetical protein